MEFPLQPQFTLMLALEISPLSWLGHLDKPSSRSRGRRRKGTASLFGVFDGKLGMSQSEHKWLLGITPVECETLK